MGIAKERLSLADGWKYKEGEQSEAGDSSVWHNAQPLPTSIHLDLLANHTIPDPFLGKNEELVQWVGDKTWIYEKQFTIPGRLRSNPGQQVDLVFEGLDTFTTVTLDNVKILETENMFVSHRVNITDQIRSTKTPDKEMHTLQIIFHNAKQMATEEMERHAEHSWFSFHFGNKRLAARKAQYHFVCVEKKKIPPCSFCLLRLITNTW